MLAKTKKWKQGKIKTTYLLALAVFFRWFGADQREDRAHLGADARP